YTVVLVCMPGFDAPDHMFDLVTSRIASVTIGIVCSGLVAALTTSRAAERGLHQALRRSLADLNDYVRQVFANGEEGQLAALRRKLAGAIATLDPQCEFAAAESAEVAPLRDTLRAALVAMFGILTTATSLRESLHRLPSDTASQLVPYIDSCRDLLERIDHTLSAPADDTAAQLAAIDRDLKRLIEDIEGALAADNLPLLVAQDRLTEVVDELRVALAGLRALVSGQVPETRRHRQRLAFHLDWRGGLINAVRAALAVWLGGALWLLTAWPDGWMLMAMVVPNAGLLALRDHPEKDAVEFLKGCVLASLVSWLVLLYLLPLSDLFLWECLVLGPVIFVAVLMSSHPRTVFMGVGLAVFFLTLLAPTNPMVYDASLFLSSVLPTIGGAALTMVVFRVVLPVDARGHALALVRVMRNDIRALLTNRREITPAAWESRMHDRMLRLVGRMRVSEMHHPSLIRGGFAALRIGREIIRSRRLLAPLAHDPAVSTAMEPARQALRRLGQGAPSAELVSLRAAARNLLDLVGEGHPQAPVLARVAPSLLEMAMLLGRNRRFFHTFPVT
ncbi:MAG TPA: FUSC family protein, partial [Magnetospirillum sp.]|nr:FUSC family protein [Magnetospirillum sp.]